MGWVRSANRLANKPYRQSAGFLQNANRFLEREKRQFFDFQAENRTKLALSLAPSTRFERVAFRLGVALIRYSSVVVKRGKPLMQPEFTVVTLLIMCGFF